jgi:hypothetical protein
MKNRILTKTNSGAKNSSLNLNSLFIFYPTNLNLIYKTTKNGSITIQFLDVLRRFTLIVVGVIFFKENYTPIIYFSLSLMFVGSLIGLIDYENYIYLYHKYIQKNHSNYIINPPSIEVFCINQ